MSSTYFVTVLTELRVVEKTQVEQNAKTPNPNTLNALNVLKDLLNQIEAAVLGKKPVPEGFKDVYLEIKELVSIAQFGTAVYLEKMNQLIAKLS